MSPISEIKDAATERLRNPFVGAVGISFFLFNWRIFAYLFLSDVPVNDRLVEIGKLTNGLLIIGVLGYPIVFVFGYVTIMPWVSLVIEWVSHFGTDKLIQLKRSQELRLDLIRQFTDDKLTLERALNIARPNDKGKLQKAVDEWRSVIIDYRDTAGLPESVKKQLNEGLRKLHDAFLNFLGTPLFDKSDPKK